MAYGPEILYTQFVELLKKEGTVRASPSHTQTHPTEISWAAILDWQFDGEVFAITSTGKRAVASPSMPAFRRYIPEK